LCVVARALGTALDTVLDAEFGGQIWVFFDTALARMNRQRRDMSLL